MMRRKIWASVACCLALGGMVNAQDAAPKAKLGLPQPSVTARGAAPDYPMYTPPAGTRPYTNGVRPASGFATEVQAKDIPAKDIPKGTPMVMPGPMGPMGSGVIAPPVPDPKVITVPPGSMLPPPAITTGAPFLDATGMPGYGCDNPMMPGVPGCAPCCDLPCAWIAPEYIHWKTRGANIPALVTQAPAGSRGVLGDPNTTVLYGNQEIMDNWRSGIRVRGGGFFDRACGNGFDLGFFALGGTRNGFSADSTGDPGLFRPFTNPDGTPNAQLVGFISPTGLPILAGRVSVTNSTEFLGAEANFRSVLNCDASSRLDFLIGYRYLRMRDTLSIREDLRAIDPQELAAPLGTQITVFDHFETLNQFHGAQIGLAGEWRNGKLSVNYRASVALGITHIRTDIDGATRVATPDGVNTVSQGGLLALPTNIGKYSDYQFSVVPEVGLNLGYDLTKNVRIFGGYNLLYWSKVARAGDQVDTVVNQNFIPNPDGDVPTGAKRPAFGRQDSSFWAHGWSLGVEFKW